jgi:hypothetical protein
VEPLSRKRPTRSWIRNADPHGRQRRRFGACLLAAAAVLPSTPVRADVDKVSVSGFGTLGLTSTSGAHDWQFHRNSAQVGAGRGSAVSAALDTRLGMQVNWNPDPQWEAALQGVALNRPQGTPLAQSIEWAYLGYRIFPNTRLRLGRTTPDMFLFADSRNVGFALPWARPPVDFYGFAPVAAIDGVDLEQRWSRGEASWRARLTAGSFHTSLTNDQSVGMPFNARANTALGITREEGGLLLKASFLRSRAHLEVSPAFEQLRQSLAQVAALPVPGVADSLDPLWRGLWTGGTVSYTAMAAQYETGPWSLITEGSVLSVPDSPLNARRGYVSVGYRSGTITYYGLASRVVPSRPAVLAPDLSTPLTPVLGAQGAQQVQLLAGYAAAAQARYRFDQSSLGVGMRWDFLPTAALKLQIDHVQVRSGGAAGWQHADGRSARATTASALVDFMWGP